MEMEKQMFGLKKKNVCWARQRHWDTERNFNKQALLPVDTPSSYYS